MDHWTRTAASVLLVLLALSGLAWPLLYYQRTEAMVVENVVLRQQVAEQARTLQQAQQIIQAYQRQLQAAQTQRRPTQ